MDPHEDPRLDALAAGFALLLGAARGASTTSPAVTSTDMIKDMIKELPG